MENRKIFIALLIVAIMITGVFSYQNSEHQKYVKVKTKDLKELKYNAPTDYLLLLIPNSGKEKEGEEITYIAPITSLDAKPKLAYSTEGTYTHVYNNLYKTKENEFQLYDESHEKLKTITFSSTDMIASPQIKEEDKKIKFTDNRNIIATGYSIIMQTESLYHEFDYDVKINGETYQIYDIVSMSNFYQQQ